MSRAAYIVGAALALANLVAGVRSLVLGDGWVALAHVAVAGMIAEKLSRRDGAA